ncbi:unnamed protein product [Pieris brassicae]|uniref:Peptidase M14 domain-containing protein n=1 Tax=Pieris brassicae TaxID=7116 RepID=A0A9P0TUL2_PIEBR|nr:unnamed protein product [Pieris brassicae]
MFSDIQVLVNPMDLEIFKERLMHFGMNSRILSDNIQREFDQQVIHRYLRLKTSSYSWNNYHSLEDVYQWMSDIAAKYPKLIKLKDIGKTIEGREILAMNIHRPGSKRKVIIDAAMHGNEWITAEFVTYLANELVKADKAMSSKLRRVAHKYNWFLIPVANPDGYVYSMKNDRLWRNNRHIENNNTIGVDLNRNFDYSFCTQGANKEPSKDYFCGSKDFSEPESRAIADFVRIHRKDLYFYISLHAYGQKILIPYSDRVKHVENFGELENYGKQAILKMYKVNGVKYGIGTIYDSFGYRISGDSASWVKKNHKVKYVLTMLLRDNGTYGHALPANQILPTCEETLVGITEILTARHRRVAPCIPKRYKNFSLIRGIPVNEAHLSFFNNLSALYNVNYWRLPGLVHRPIEFIIAPTNREDFVRTADKAGVYYSTLIEDVQKALDMQTVKSYIRRNMESFDWRSFFRLQDIYAWLWDLETQYPEVMQVKTIGKSVEKRDILAVNIEHKTGRAKPKPKVIVEGGIHAREWISQAFVTYFLYQILTAVESNNTLRIIAETYQWHFIPVLNPDGYDYTHNTDRMHRKNMNHVDLNRNFGIAFGTVGVSGKKSSEIYCGPHAFSEPESKAMADFVHANSRDLMFYLAFHAYGQYMILPYTHLKVHLENYDEVHEMGVMAASRIAARYGTQYEVGTAYDTVGYMTSGVSGCWVKKTFNVPYVMTFEMRDQGQHGFALPPKQILPTCKETMDGIISLLMHKKGKLKDQVLPKTDSGDMIFINHVVFHLVLIKMFIY